MHYSNKLKIFKNKNNIHCQCSMPKPENLDMDDLNKQLQIYEKEINETKQLYQNLQIKHKNQCQHVKNVELALRRKNGKSLPNDKVIYRANFPLWVLLSIDIVDNSI